MSTNLNVNITGNASSLTTAMNQVQQSTVQTMGTMNREVTKAQGMFGKLQSFFSGGMRGLTFGLTGMATAGIEAVGMFSMLQDAQTRVSESQAHLNELQAQGVTSGADYQRTTNELEKAQRALRFSLRFTILSFADLIPFVLNTINSFVKIKTAGQAAAQGTMAVATATNTLSGATKLATTANAANTVSMALLQRGYVAFGTTQKEVAVGYQLLAREAGASTIAINASGSALRTALIRTGIGAILVAAGTALVAFTQNWWGFRDAVMAAGKALGDFLPFLRPVLDALKTVGDWVTRLFGGTVPDAVDESKKKFGELSDEGIKSAERVKTAFSSMMQELIVMPGSAKEDWKAQWDKLKDIGFNKEGIRWFKDNVFKPAAIAKSLTDNIAEGMNLIKNFKPPGNVMRKLVNDMIDQTREAIRKGAGKLDFLGELVTILKEHKKDPNLPALVASWFANLPQAMKDTLSKFDIDLPAMFEAMGFNSDEIAAMVKKTWTEGWNNAFKLAKPGQTLSFGTPGSSGAIPLGKKGGDTGVTALVNNIITELQTALSPEKLEGVKQKLVSGILALPTSIDTLVKPFATDLMVAVINGMVAAATIELPRWARETFTASNIQNALIGALSGVNAIATTMMTIVFNAQAWAGALFDFINDLGESFVIGLISWTAKPTIAATKVWENLIAWLDKALTGMVTNLQTLGTIIAGAIIDGINVAIDAGGKFVTSIGESILGFFGEVYRTITSGLVAIGTSIVTTIWQPIADFFTNLQSEIDKINPFANKPPSEEEGENTPTSTPVGLFTEDAKKGTQIILLKDDAIKVIAEVATAIALLSAVKAPITLDPSLAIEVIAGVGVSWLALSILKTPMDLDPALAIGTIAATGVSWLQLSILKPPMDLNPQPAQITIGLTNTAWLELSNAVPAMELNNKPAIKAIDVVANRIDSLSGINPPIPVNNNPAIKAIDVIAKRIDSLSKIVPDINVNNKPALKAIDVIANRIETLPDGEVTVHVGLSGPGASRLAEGGIMKFAQGGILSAQAGKIMTTSGPALVLAGDNPGGREDVAFIPHNNPWPTLANLMNMYFSKRQPGNQEQKGGDIVVNNILMDEVITRRTRMQMGKNTYTMR